MVEAVLIYLVAGAVFTINLIFAIPVSYWLLIDSRGRDTGDHLIWFPSALLFGIMFGPFVLLELVMYLKLRPGGKMIKCPSCGHGKLSHLSHCPHCGKQTSRSENEVKDVLERRTFWKRTDATGTDLENPERPGNRSHPLKRKRISTGSCPYCGRDLYDWEKRCKRCGRIV